MKEQTDDFQNMVNLLGVYSEAANRISAMEAKINSDLLELVDEDKSEYASLQKAMTEAETALELIARRHPEWFTEKKSIKTPYGTVSFRSTPKLEISNAELSIHIIEGDESLNSEEFIRSEKALNIEALERLDDASLARLKIKRVKEEKFSVKEASLDLGKAVKEAAKSKDRVTV